MDQKYIKLVQDWVKLDNVVLRNTLDVKTAKDEVKRIEDSVATVIEEKKKIEKDIIDYVQKNKFETMQLKISDGTITFSKKTTQKPITQKFLKDALEQYSEEHVDEPFDFMKVYEYIIGKIEKTVNYSINRSLKEP